MSEERYDSKFQLTDSRLFAGDSLGCVVPWTFKRNLPELDTNNDLPGISCKY